MRLSSRKELRREIIVWRKKGKSGTQSPDLYLYNLNVNVSPFHLNLGLFTSTFRRETLIHCCPPVFVLDLKKVISVLLFILTLISRVTRPAYNGG